MPRPLDFIVPCRNTDAAPRPPADAHRPWRTASGELIVTERPAAPNNNRRRTQAPGRAATVTRSVPRRTSNSSASGTRRRADRPGLDAPQIVRLVAVPPPPDERTVRPIPPRSGVTVRSRVVRSLTATLRTMVFLMIVALIAAIAASPDVRATAAAALPGATPASAFGRDHVRILLLGADHNYDPQGRRLHSGGRSDTLILADIDFARGRIHLCSIPRDTEAVIPDHGARRVNAAYALGGVDLSRRTVERLTGLTVHHTVAVDLDGFKDAVDALGGVEVDVDKPLRYVDAWGGLDIDIAAGRQRLDGEHAMQFVRFRHDALADIGRARRQQEFMRALGDAMRRPSTVVAWPGVVRAVSDHTDTDLTPAQMVALGRFARSLEGDSLTTETLPGSFHHSRWRPDEDGVRRMAARLTE